MMLLRLLLFRKSSKDDERRNGEEYPDSNDNKIVHGFLWLMVYMFP
jgi:hypothetical protein